MERSGKTFNQRITRRIKHSIIVSNFLMEPGVGHRAGLIVHDLIERFWTSCDLLRRFHELPSKIKRIWH